MGVALAPSQQLGAAGTQQGWLRLFTIPTGKVFAEVEAHRGMINSVAFSHDGSILASGSADRTVRLWKIGDRLEPLMTLRLPGQVMKVAFADGVCLLVLVRNEPTIRIWDLHALRQHLAELGLEW
jgi:WD40 repeat protein